MKNFLILFFFISVTWDLSAQKIATRKIKCDPFYFDNFILVQNGEKSFIISKYKTTNKEYLCYLQWLFRVYGKDYPGAYIEMLPDTIAYPDIFDPSKFNDPVRGISKKQAQAFCQWRSDRLNEYILIREGILKKDFRQIDEDCFNTESYLSSYYLGLVKNDVLDKCTKQARQVIYTDFFLIPGLYLASKAELKICDSLVKLNTIENRKEIKSDLDWWMSNEIKIAAADSNYSPFKSYLSKLQGVSLSKDRDIKYLIKKYQKELACKTLNFDTANVITSDNDYRTFNLHTHKTKLRYYKLIVDSLHDPFVYPRSNSEQKDEYGRTDYVYIADNYDGTPICIYKSALEENNMDDVTKNGFYCAMNIPFRLNWELQQFTYIIYSYRHYRY